MIHRSTTILDEVAHIHQRGGLALACVDIRAGDEQVAVGYRFESRDSSTYMPRLACHVEHRVSVLAGDLVVGVGAVPIGTYQSDVRRRVPGFAAGQADHLVLTASRVERDTPTEPRGASQDKQSHATSQTPDAPDGRRSAPANPIGGQSATRAAIASGCLDVGVPVADR